MFVHCLFLQVPVVARSKVKNVLYIWFIHLRAKNLLWVAEFVAMLTPSKKITFLLPFN